MALQPSEITGLRAWYDADQLVGLSDGDPVDTWTDEANAFDLTAAGAARPTYKTNIVNGKPVLRFDGSDDILTAASAADWKFLHDGTSFDVFVVWKTRLVAPNDVYGLLGTNAGTGTEIGLAHFWDNRVGMTTARPAMLIGDGTNPANFDSVNNTDPLARPWGALGNKWHVSHLRLDDTDRGFMFLDGLVGGFATKAVSGFSASNPTSTLSVGAVGGGGAPLDGDIAEIIFYNSQVGFADAQQLLLYLIDKYDLDARAIEQDTIVVANETGHNGFPGYAIATDGTRLAAYRNGADHDAAGDAGVIRTRTSTDGGVTWSAFTTILSTAGTDYRDPSLTKLASGTLIMAGGRRGSAGPTNITDGSWTIRSADNGDSWDAEVNPNDSFTGFSRAGGNVLELADGDLLLAVYGIDSGDTKRSVRVVKSTDGGDSWSHLSEILDGPTDNLDYNETGLYLAGNGDVIAITREEDGSDFWKTISTDSGATWGTKVKLLEGAEAMPRPEKANGAFMYRWPNSFPEMIQAFSFDELATVQSGYQHGWDVVGKQQGTYGQNQIDSLGRLGAVYAIQTATTDSHVYFRNEINNAGPFSDDFTGADGAPWDEDKWNQDTGSGGGSTVIDNNQGKASGSTGNANSGGRGRGKQGRVANQELTGTLQLCETGEPCNGALWLQTSDDWSGLDWPTEGYGVRLPASSDTATLLRASGGVLAQLDSAIWPRDTGLKQFKFRRQSNKVRFRIWDDGDAEPEGWLLSADDSVITPDDVGAFQISYTCPTAPSVDACALYDDITVGENDTPIPNGGGNGGNGDDRIGGTGAIRRSAAAVRRGRRG